MTTPHDYYGPDGYPHLHSKGNSAITADPDWLANEHGDMLPLGSTLGKGPQGDGVIALVKESDDVKGTFILQFLNDKTMETFLESPNLHAGILSARTDDSNHTLYIDLMRKGFNKQIAEMTLPEGEQGTRLYLHKTSVPVEIFSDNPEDLEYTFNAEDLFYRGTSRTDTEEEAPRVNDTVVSCIVWRNTKEDGTREDLAYLAVGMVQAVTNDKDKVGEPITNVHVIFRTLYMMNAQLQSDFAQEDPNEVDFIKHREWIEDKKNKVTSLISEPIDDEQYPNAKAVYRELAALKDATVIAAVVDTHEDMLNLPMSALTNKDIIMVLHDNSERIEEEKRGGTAYWKYTLLDKNKKNYKTIPESKLKLLSVLPPYATELELQEEIKRAEAAEKALQDALNAETKARSDADDALTKAIESEAKQRENADNALDESKSPRLIQGENITFEEQPDGKIKINSTGGGGSSDLPIVVITPTEIEERNLTSEHAQMLIDKCSALQIRWDEYNLSHIYLPTYRSISNEYGASLSFTSWERTEESIKNSTQTESLETIWINIENLETFSNSLRIASSDFYTVIGSNNMANEVLSSAKKYTDDEIAKIPGADVDKKYVDDQDQATLSSAKGYTDSALEAYTKTEQIQTWLNNKVEKLNTANRVYTTNGAGADTSRALVTTPTANGIPCYSASKTLPTATPVNDTDAATKKYVDDAVISPGFVTKEYVDGADTTTLNNAKSYTNNALSPLSTRLNGITPKAMIFSMEDGTTETWYVDTETSMLKSKKKGKK